MTTLASRLGPAVGDKTAKAIAKAFGYTTVGELLAHYPRRYVDRDQISSVDDFEEGQIVTLIATCVSVRSHTYRDKRTRRLAYRTEVVAEVERGRFVMTYFAKLERVAEFNEQRYAPGTKVMVAGKTRWNTFKQLWELVNPHTSDKDVDKLFERSSLCPIYRSTSTLTSWQIDDAITLLLPALDTVPEILPSSVRAEHKLVDRLTALRWVHAPDDFQQVGAGRRRIKFDEAVVAQAVLAQRRRSLLAISTTPRTGRREPGEGLLAAFDAHLPFALTAGQHAVCDQILADLAGSHPMHRLLQGEVGSGKTVVALRAMLRVVDSGGQAALLAPTDVLAQQHLRSITAMLGDLAGGGMLGGADEATQVVLLTGSIGAAARRQSLEAIGSGEGGIVIGTHALLEETVRFHDLGLVVVDEQHRFGVEQRAALTLRAERPPHVLVMTATPIPRTVALTKFGDLEVSTLTELPAGRAAIQTSVVPLAEQPAWEERVWERAREEVAKGHQVYVVCPRISAADDETDDETGDETGGETDGDPEDRGPRRPSAAVELLAPQLARQLAPTRVDLLHGRLPADEKDRTMRAFAAGEVDVLVSTTVIEVGVDVSNATMMVVMDADRFGVSQLHQLRGRVGRGSLPGLCLLVTHSDELSPARQRLDAVAATTDGFELADLDLRQRREGDVLGTAQSGSSSLLLSAVRDEAIISEARDIADEIVTTDPTLTDHPDLATAVAQLEDAQRADYLERA
ncbi:MAG: ATP-dependent DNA helicase RecG [Nocardioidaceae bacterium]